MSTTPCSRHFLGGSGLQARTVARGRFILYSIRRAEKCALVRPLGDLQIMASLLPVRFL